MKKDSNTFNCNSYEVSALKWFIEKVSYPKEEKFNYPKDEKEET